MSVKETIHKWVDSIPDDSPCLRDLYEQAQLDMAVEEARKSIRDGRCYTLGQVEQMMEEKWAKRHSA